MNRADLKYAATEEGAPSVANSSDISPPRSQSLHLFLNLLYTTSSACPILQQGESFIRKDAREKEQKNFLLNQQVEQIKRKVDESQGCGKGNG